MALKGSELEESLWDQIQAAGLPLPDREVDFAASIGRKWRWDFAYGPPKMLAIEIQGGVWIGGRHTRGGGFTRDCEKYDEATLMGWRILLFTAKQIVDGYALRTIIRALS